MKSNFRLTRDKWGPFTRENCRIRLFILMYPINSLESSGRIVTLVSESKAGIVPLRQHYIPQNELSYTTFISCKSGHKAGF